jgi:hypothetical protein
VVHGSKVSVQDEVVTKMLTKLLPTKMCAQKQIPFLNSCPRRALHVASGAHEYDYEGF